MLSLSSPVIAQTPSVPDADRLRALEESQRLQTQEIERLRQELQSQSATRSPTTPDPAQTLRDRVSDPDGDSPAPDYTEGLFGPFIPVPGFPESAARKQGRFPLQASFGPGFRLESTDERFQLQIHYESQIEGRVWGQDQNPANSGFYLPRQRIFFNGHITKPIEYELAINRGVNNINLLNAFLNFHMSDEVQLRVGRFFTPLSYDQYAVSNYWLITPERSLFTTNLNLNRQIGAMLWGYLFDKRLDYAVGAFNGSRNSFGNRSRPFGQ
ncbi:MAG: OprO/OprP family phosphate-selective porin [Bacteroidales bacterium]|nr:OprO/OprP family phosphate-selective porin [Bacteroidales bacterium]